MYLLFLNLCIYYFKFMYLIYGFILFELCLLFLNSCIYSIHVFIIFEFIYRNLVNFRATNFSILIVRCGYSSRFRFTLEILSPRKKRQTIITYLPGHVNAY